MALPLRTPPISRPLLAALVLLLAWPAQARARATAPSRPGGGGKEKTMSLILESSAFTHGGAIPAIYTCDGGDISPPLVWRELPARTKSLALIVDDPDAPDPRAPKTTWVHWVLYDLPPMVKGLSEGVQSRHLPVGTKEGRNDWKRTGYGGPCPPIGRHRYFFKLYALDVMFPDLTTPTKAVLERVMAGHILSHAELMGTYERHH